MSSFIPSVAAAPKFEIDFFPFHSDRTSSGVVIIKQVQETPTYYTALYYSNNNTGAAGIESGNVSRIDFIFPFQTNNLVDAKIRCKEFFDKFYDIIDSTSDIINEMIDKYRSNTSVTHFRQFSNDIDPTKKSVHITINNAGDRSIKYKVDKFQLLQQQGDDKIIMLFVTNQNDDNKLNYTMTGGNLNLLSETPASSPPNFDRRNKTYRKKRSNKSNILKQEKNIE